MQGLPVRTSDVQLKQNEIYQNAIKISHRIESNLDSNCLVIFVTGKRSIGDSLYCWQKIIQLCDENEVENVQLTLALRGKFEPFEAIKSYQEIIAFIKPYNFNIALTDLNRLSLKDTQVACNMALSQGLNCFYFDNEIDAQNWLAEQAMTAV